MKNPSFFASAQPLPRSLTKECRRESISDHSEEQITHMRTRIDSEDSQCMGLSVCDRATASHDFIEKRSQL